MRREIHREFYLLSPNGNMYFCFYREMKLRVKTNELIPLVVINIKKGHEKERAFIHNDDMNEVMRKSVMKNFKAWCIAYIHDHYFDPKTDTVKEA